MVGKRGRERDADWQNTTEPPPGESEPREKWEPSMKDPILETQRGGDRVGTDAGGDKAIRAGVLELDGQQSLNQMGNRNRWGLEMWV